MLHQLEARLLKIHKGKRLPRLRDMSQLSAGSNFYLPSYHGLKPDQFWHEMPIREWMEVSGWSRTDIWAAFKDWNYFLNHPEKMKFARDSYDRLTKYLPMSKFERAMVMIDHERYWEAMPGQAMVRAQVLRILQHIRFMYDLPHRRSPSSYLIEFRDRVYGFHMDKWIYSDPAELTSFKLEWEFEYNLLELEKTTLSIPLPNSQEFLDIWAGLNLYNDYEDQGEKLMWNLAALCQMDITIHRIRRTIVRN